MQSDVNDAWWFYPGGEVIYSNFKRLKKMESAAIFSATV